LAARRPCREKWGGVGLLTRGARPIAPLILRLVSPRVLLPLVTVALIAGPPLVCCKKAAAVSAETWTNFNVSFLSSLLAGFLYSIPTGVITALLVVWRVERNRCKRELATFRARLRTRLYRPNSQPPGSALSTLPLGADAVEQLLQESAVDLWQEYLPEQRPFLVLLRQVEETYAHYLARALLFDQRLSALIRTHHATQALPKEMDEQPRRTFLDYLNEYLSLPAEQGGAPPVHFPSVVAFIGAVSTNYSIVSGNQLLQELAAGLWLARVTLERTLDFLREAVASDPVQGEEFRREHGPRRDQAAPPREEGGGGAHR
jgi:hypothetical protein